jgi:AcrR family transcriptional regulator
MSTPRPTRREQQRVRTLAEIKKLAMAQIADGGVESLSLNAIARHMAMSGAAIYRYFNSRDQLLAALAVDGYTDLADALETAADRRHASPQARWHAIAAAYRGWALDQPHRYRLVFSSQVGSGELAPEQVIPAAGRSMLVLLNAIAAAAPSTRNASVQPSRTLSRQLRDWQKRTGMPDLPDATLLAGLNAWTRLHGVISLELDGHLPSTGVDPQLLYDAEVSSLVA